MSLIICKHCSKGIDEDYDAEHEGECELNEYLLPTSVKRVMKYNNLFAYLSLGWLVIALVLWGYTVIAI